MSIKQSVAGFSPNTSLVLLDSRYRRDPQDTPADFQAQLSCGIRGQKFIYKGVSWSQSIFNHNLSNNEIIFEVENEAANAPLVVYARPWSLFNSFDGNDPGTFFQPPQPGSYGYDIQFAFNNDIRLLASNLVAYTPSVGGNPIQFFFEYHPARGYVLYCKSAVAPNPTIRIRILQCNWISSAYFVHGFGKFDITSNTITPSSDQFQNAIYSGTPTLQYTRYFTVVCKEISRDRSFPSISNRADQDLPFEIGVFFINKDYMGTFLTEKSTGDETVIPLKFGTEPQVLRLQVKDEFGKVFSCGHPATDFTANPLIPSLILNEYNEADGRGYHAMNLLLFGHSPNFGAPFVAQQDRTDFLLPNVYNVLRARNEDLIIVLPVDVDLTTPANYSSFPVLKFTSANKPSFIVDFEPKIVQWFFNIRIDDIQFTPVAAPLVSFDVHINIVRVSDDVIVWNESDLAVNPAPHLFPASAAYVFISNMHNNLNVFDPDEQYYIEMIFDINGGGPDGGTWILTLGNNASFVLQSVVLQPAYHNSLNSYVTPLNPYGPNDIKMKCDEIIHSIAVQLE